MKNDYITNIAQSHARAKKGATMEAAVTD